MPDGSMSLRHESSQSKAAPLPLSDNAADEARGAFDRATLLAEYIHTAAAELYEKAINSQTADATDDMHFTLGVSLNTAIAMAVGGVLGFPAAFALGARRPHPSGQSLV
jgi:hypothetical protein